MSIITAASGNSVWRGYDYFKEGKVHHLVDKGDGVYAALVSGNAVEPYAVTIDTQHVRSSHCECPHANGRIICKHMVALFFAAVPGEVAKFEAEVAAYEEEEERYQTELEGKICKYLHGLKKDVLEDLLFDLLYELPDWMFDQFVNEHIE